jgi:hypothetical protein
MNGSRSDQRDRRIRVFGETTCNDAVGRPRANNDNVVGFLGSQCLPHSCHWYRSINNPELALRYRNAAS